MQRDDWYTTRRDARRADDAEDGRPDRRRARAGPPGGARSDRRGPGALRGAARRGLLGSLRACGERRLALPQVVLPARQLGKQVLPEFVQHRRAPAPPLRPSAPAPSTATASPPATARWSPTACCRAISSAPTRRASWACRPPANAGGSHNLIIQPGEHDLAGLIKQMGRGLLVTELLGHGVNYVTGDYSRGAAGFWVENGKIAYAGRGDHHRRQPARHAGRASSPSATTCRCAAPSRPARS
jgi:PmbA protein